MGCGVICFVCCLSLLFGAGVFGYPDEDLVTGLPGQPEVSFRQFSGYVDVDEKAGRSLFYYFVEAEKDVHRLPLTLWLNGAEDMLVFMKKWYEKFPEFLDRPLFLTGESYAGHYIPQLASLMIDHNKHSKGHQFNIKGVALGNPLLKLDRDVPAVTEFMWSHGMISDENYNAIRNECDFDDYSFIYPHNESDSCNAAINEENRAVSDYINVYDVIVDVTKMSMGIDVCMGSERTFYFNLPEVQKALHANRTNLPYDWKTCADYGDQDSVVPLVGSRTIVRELAADMKMSITVPYSAWFHKGQVGGWQTEYGKLLTFATVRGAAHMVPYAQPGRALHLFSSFIRGRRLPNTTSIPIDQQQYYY
nr:serine carboxypeptidase-like 42 [Ipomoea trifida]GMD02789.1 serine carboxypeptidase-like 42 [Ipomoea batatas]GMD08848.1 serine carboxypeptidase-like 42 [Ipomoea batatas]GMD11264.1 serine carboxypeptidase-like 42 [Ipomoea batatas]